MTEHKKTILAQFRLFIDEYYHLSDAAFQRLADLAQIREIAKNEILLSIGQVSKHVYYIHQGALIAFFMDEAGNTYNKNIFLEDCFAGSTVSALLKEPSGFTLQAIEDTTLLSFNYQRYKELIDANDEIKNFYIAYLEKSWVIEKEQREISIVMETAAVRYQRLLSEYPNIDRRIPLQHIASNLGITPTQLSRIRKEWKEKQSNQHM